MQLQGKEVIKEAWFKKSLFLYSITIWLIRFNINIPYKFFANLLHDYQRWWIQLCLNSEIVC